MTPENLENLPERAVSQGRHGNRVLRAAALTTLWIYIYRSSPYPLGRSSKRYDKHKAEPLNRPWTSRYCTAEPTV
jgi:hypothetical protein